MAVKQFACIWLTKQAGLFDPVTGETSNETTVFDDAVSVVATTFSELLEKIGEQHGLELSLDTICFPDSGNTDNGDKSIEWFDYSRLEDPEGLEVDRDDEEAFDGDVYEAEYSFRIEVRLVRPALLSEIR